MRLKHDFQDLPVNIQQALFTLPLVIEQVVRFIPNRRYVCRGVFNHQAVYAKIFVGKTAQAYALRDKAGVLLLQKAQIKTPPLLMAHAIDREIYILIYAAIENALNAEDLWRSSDALARHLLLKQLVQKVAQHHQAGLLQTDLHLKNFLVQQAGAGDLIYTLDGDGVRLLSAWWSQHQKHRNLATLFSKMDVLDDGWVEDCYALYCAALGIEITPGACKKILRHTQEIRHHVSSGYADKKVFRNCTDVTVRKNFKRFTAIATGYGLSEQALNELDQWFSDTQRNIKNGNTCTVAKAQLANQCLIIKRYNIKSVWHAIWRAIQPSRAAKSWANAYRLKILNIATASPLALVEERLGFLRRRAYFLSEYVAAPDALQYFAEAQMDDKRKAAQHLAVLLYKLYLLKISHGDLKASNIKIVNHQPLLIDLDSMQANGGWRQYVFTRKHVKDLKRFIQNWEDNKEVTHLLKQALIAQYVAQPVLTKMLHRAGIL